MSTLDRFSAVTFPWGRRPPTLDEIVDATVHAEKLGFYSMNIPLVNVIPRDPGGPFARFNNCYTLDTLALLPAMVTATDTVRIAVDGIPMPHLPPFEWAKYFASLDVISAGRTILGVCLGFGEEVFAAYGVDQRKRGRMVDEQLEIITRLWTEDAVTYHGDFYDLDNVTLDPKPAQKPHPPIWVGGRQKSIPRAARYCEYINSLWPSVQEVRDEYVPMLKEQCRKWGTDTKIGAWFYCKVTPDREMPESEVNEWFANLMDMEIPVVPSEVTIAGSPRQCADKIRQYMDAGMDHFVVDFQRHGLEPYEVLIEQLDIFAEEVAPLLE